MRPRDENQQQRKFTANHAHPPAHSHCNDKMRACVHAYVCDLFWLSLCVCACDESTQCVICCDFFFFFCSVVSFWRLFRLFWYFCGLFKFFSCLAFMYLSRAVIGGFNAKQCFIYRWTACSSHKYSEYIQILCVSWRVSISFVAKSL